MMPTVNGNFHNEYCYITALHAEHLLAASVGVSEDINP